MLYTLGLNDPLILIDILSFEDHMEDFFQISKVSRSFFFLTVLIFLVVSISHCKTKIKLSHVLIFPKSSTCLYCFNSLYF